MTLTEFLLARIAEDEAGARAANLQSSSWWVDGPAKVSGEHWVYATGAKFPEREVAEHVARFDPARVLADCEAKRRIVGYSIETGFNDPVRHLAAVYADHPDYDEEWRP